MMNTVLVADARHIPLPDESVHLVVTSSPYWSLRDYGLKPSVWGGDPGCEHIWARAQTKANATASARWQHEEGGRDGHNRFANAGVSPEIEMVFSDVTSGFCQRCGAWLGCLGLEPDPGMFVEHIVEVFREIKRVLRRDGVAVCNLGDSFGAGTTEQGRRFADKKSWGEKWRAKSTQVTRNVTALGVRSKDKLLIPHRVAIALQADGWWVRHDVPCLKVAAMPEAVQDRFTTAHEFIFHLTKSAHYYWDPDAIRQVQAPICQVTDRFVNPKRAGGVPLGVKEFDTPHRNLGHGRNFRTSDLILDENGEPLVYMWHPEPFPGAHFAVFPVGLAEPWVKAACPERTCVKCGKGWVRLVEKTGERIPEWQRACGGDADGEYDGQAIKDYDGTGAENASDVKRRILAGMVEKTHRWEPACKCGAPTQPGLVLDPFSGAGSTGIAAARCGRRFIGIDLSPTYVALAKERIAVEGFGSISYTRDDGRRERQLQLDFP